MADGYPRTLLNGLPNDIKGPIVQAIEHVQNNWRLGDGPRANNAQWYLFTSTSAANAGDEFTILHGQGQAPSKLIEVLDLTLVGSQYIPLTVSRAPDAQRIYLKSTSTGAVFTIYAEF